MKNDKNHTEIDFWQSNTDLMSAFALMMLLLIMLLILYLMQIPENISADGEANQGFLVDDELGDRTDEAYHYPEQNGRGEEESGEYTKSPGQIDGGEAGAGTALGFDQQFYGEYPLPTSSGKWSKAAVYATVVDQETGRAVRTKGMTFELYEEQIKNGGGALRLLNTYYPVKVEFHNYETTKEGGFYLPEKIEEGHYYFKQITGPEGYDLAEAERFSIDDAYDWPDPYMVSVKISPSKNVISIALEDGSTGDPIQGGTFKINAAADIITADQSVRYAKHELADTVTLDANGRGESRELYLGAYTVTQDEIPPYYAGIPQGVEAQVKKKGENPPEELVFTCEKTEIRVQLADELYANRKLEGVEFLLRCEGRPELSKSGVTDQNGEVTFTDLEKDVMYSLSQNSVLDGYRHRGNPVEIFVSEQGLIDGQTFVSLPLTNYVARVRIEAKDKLFGKPVSNVNLALYNSSGALVRTWTSNGSAQTLEDLPGGAYYVILDGDKSKRFDYEISEDVALQEFSAALWTMEDLAVLGVGGCVLLLGVWGTAVVLKKKKQSKKAHAGKERKREG